MKKLFFYSILTIVSVSLIQACGPSQKEKQVQRMAKQNQIAQARQDSLAKAQAEAEARKREAQLEQKQKGQSNNKAKTANQTNSAKKQTSEKKVAANHTTSAQASDQSTPSTQSTQIRFVRGGNYTIQVGSWRSDSVAHKQLSTWEKRGYDHAYIVKYGKENTGNIWFRVRLGVVQTKEMAKEVQQKIKNEYNASSWISYVGTEKISANKK